MRKSYRSKRRSSRRSRSSKKKSQIVTMRRGGIRL